MCSKKNNEGPNTRQSQGNQDEEQKASLNKVKLRSRISKSSKSKITKYKVQATKTEGADGGKP